MHGDELSKLIKVATVDPLPYEDDFAVVNPDGTTLHVCRSKITRIMSQGLEFAFEYVKPEDGTFGRKLPDENWTGIMGMLVRGEANISTSGLLMRSDRNEAVQFTFPVHVDDVTFMTNKPEPYMKTFAIFQTFCVEVWIGIGLSIIFTSLLLYILLQKKQTYSLILLEIIGNLLEKSFSLTVKQRNTTYLLFALFIGITVLTNCYKAVILSIITIPKMVGVRDIPDLAEAVKDSSFGCFSFKGSAATTGFFESNDDRLKPIEECLKRNEIEKLFDFTPFFKYPHKKAFFLKRSLLTMYGNDYLVSDDSFYLTYYAIGYTKKFCCHEKLEKVVYRIIEGGFFNKYVSDRNYRAYLKTLSSETGKMQASSLSVIHFTGSFLVLFIGHFLSFLILIIEIIREKHNTFMLKNVLFK